MRYVLWIVQALLAAVFLFAGASKFIMSVEEMTKDIHLPGLFLRFIGAVEILGAIGLILPSLLRIRPGLTPLAAFVAYGRWKLVPIADSRGSAFSEAR
jgi:uncharacterized membrane protein YphA (DoxX/SURF4 family)